ncbi:MAG: 23S rRNA (uracil(1939)-C(5))-methyltransferase RlmD [Patescibacteria group bacterium]
MSKKEIEVYFEKIGHNGVSIGKLNGKVVFAYGVLPGERAKVRILKEKKNFIEGEIVEIIEKSKNRVEFKEDHYLSCSPWQCFSYDFQIETKKNLLKEIFFEFAKENLELNEFYPANNIFEYRTKIEYSFLKEEKYYLAFYKRNNPFEKIKLKNGCLLINKKANESALKILEEINKQNLDGLKSLILRFSQSNKEVLAVLLVNNKKVKFDFNLENLVGFILSYSNPKSPASNFDEILLIKGREYLREKILNLEFKYLYKSFFQNNIELFEKAIEVMKKYCQDSQKLLDLYCGVGIIGILLNEYSKNIIGVDIDKEAIAYAKINAELNNVKNFKGIVLASEKIPQDLINKTDILILDPPRVGLPKKLISNIIKEKPQKIFYLSCNPLTQARDFYYLKDFYKVLGFYGFDFYPNTPHIESLLILEIKK